MKGFKDHINLIENYIEELLKELNDNPVYDPVKYFLKLPSKRVRPLLTIISSSLYNIRPLARAADFRPPARFCRQFNFFERFRYLTWTQFI